MRSAGTIVVLLTGTLSAFAQETVLQPKPKPAAAAPKPAATSTVAAPKPIVTPSPAPKPAQTATPAAPAAAKPAPAPKPVAATGSVPAAAAPAAMRSAKDTHNAMPMAERVGIQTDLIWAGEYNGLANGDFTDLAITAIKAFQKKFKTKETGILNPQERAALAVAAKPQRDAVGWRMVDDLPGGRLGLPGKLTPQAGRGASGGRWASAHGEIVIETFRVKDTTLPAVFAQQRKEPSDRRVEYNVLKPDFFVVSGMQGLKKFYVRAQAKDTEVRGLTILYDQAVEGTMDKVVVAMSSAFTPFATAETVAQPAPQKRLVDYSTGLVVSAEGHILADRRLTDGCQVISVAKLGNADRVAEDKASDLALLRVYGARDLLPLALAGETPSGSELNLVGIADPQAQGGGNAVSTTHGRLVAGTGDAAASVDPTHAPGFSGAAAIDGNGRFLGMVQLKPQVVAQQVVAGAPGNLPAGPSLVSIDSIRKFLDAQGVRAATGRSGVEDARAAVVRVICVRK
jgi:hypothetical protein